MLPITFLTPKSFVTPSFWEELYRRKLDEYKLAVDDLHIMGFMGPSEVSRDRPVSVDSSSFALIRSENVESIMSNNFQSAIKGTMINVNTSSEYKEVNKKLLLETIALKIWKSICSGDILKNPLKLMEFTLLTFANLKQHTFTYWFDFPFIYLSILIIKVK